MLSDRRKNIAIFLLPSLVMLIVTVVVPLLYSFATSFFSLDLKYKGWGEFVGLGNYFSALKDQYFMGSIKTTVIFSVIVVAIEFIVGFAIALLFNTNVKGKNFFFSIVIIPMMITPVAVGLTWRLLLHSTLGVVNWFLSLLGIAGKAWLADNATALATVIFIDVWQQISYMVLVLLAGLVSLPKEPYEAASIDGASKWQSFKFITMPLMAPTFLVAILLRLITAFKTYDLIYVLTKGGPGTSTEVVSYYIYKTAFTHLKTSKAAAMSFILLIILIPVSYIATRILKNRNEG